MRNTMRYLLANLYDFDPAADSVPDAQLEEVDRYILARYADVAQRVLTRLRRVRVTATVFQPLNSSPRST